MYNFFAIQKGFSQGGHNQSSTNIFFPFQARENDTKHLYTHYLHHVIYKLDIIQELIQNLWIPHELGIQDQPLPELPCL